MRLAAGLRHNLGLKILSLALALFLWSFVHGSKEVERELKIPIRYVHLADSLMFAVEPPRELRILVEGPARELMFRTRFLRDVEAVVDLSGARPPQHRIAPSIAQITTPPNAGFSLVRVIEPTIVDLRLTRRIERFLPVQVVQPAEIPEGYCLAGTLRAQPGRVRCSGAEMLLENLEGIRTMPVPLRRSREPYLAKVELSYDRAHLECTPDEIEVLVPMTRRRERTFAGVPLIVVPPATAELTFDAPENTTADVTVSGPEPRIEALRREEVQVVLDLSRMAAGVYDSLRLLPNVPSWSRVERLQPGTVPVRIYAAQEGSEDALAPSDSTLPPQHSRRDD